MSHPSPGIILTPSFRERWNKYFYTQFTDEETETQQDGHFFKEFLPSLLSS